MTAAMVAAPADPGDDGDEVLMGHEPCACGALAAVVLVDDDGSVWASVRCPCGAFRPAAADRSPAAPVGDEGMARPSRDARRGGRP